MALVIVLDKIINSKGGSPSDWREIIRLLNSKPEEYNFFDNHLESEPLLIT